MSLNKKLLVGAIAGLLFSANAGAVELGVDDARLYAEELIDGTTLNDPGDTVEFEVGYNFSPGEVRYGRFECTDNLTMENVVATEGSADLDLGAINGNGTSGVFFSMTAVDEPAFVGPTQDVVITVDADNTLEDGGAVNCAFSIYDQPSQAQAGGTTGRIYTTGFQPFIERAPSFVFVGTDDNAVADVEAAGGAYTGFVGGDGVFGGLAFDLPTDVPFDANGNAMTLATLFDTDTTVELSGDFSAAADVTWDGTSADALDDDSALYEFLAIAARDGVLDFIEDGVTPIPESDYFATLNAVANAGFEVDSVDGVSVGMITRNGTQLQAPLTNVPGGWISRIALTNTGTLDRPYELSFMTEDGNVLDVDTTMTTGTIPAGGTVVIDMTQVIQSFTGKRRATVIATIAGPNSQIQGLHQIVSDAGGISNETMVRPGTN